jgi:hypothetical protein
LRSCAPIKEESGESKLAFQSQRDLIRGSAKKGIESDSRVDFNVESGRIA